MKIDKKELKKILIKVAKDCDMTDKQTLIFIETFNLGVQLAAENAKTKSVWSFFGRDEEVDKQSILKLVIK